LVRSGAPFPGAGAAVSPGPVSGAGTTECVNGVDF
jgi:hypothetical protein